MAQYTGADLVIKMDVADGGSLTDISQSVQTVNGLEIEKIVEDGHTFGDSWVEKLLSGLSQVGNITLGGIFDTGTNVKSAFFTSAHTATRSLQFTWGGTTTSDMEVWITKRKRIAERGKLTRFEVELAVSGAVTEA